MEEKSESKRYLKMRYPDECYPVIALKGHSRRVTVLSEWALVILTKGVSKKCMRAMVEGIITYPNGDKDAVHGHIVSIKDKSVVVRLLKAISTARIYEQQQWVHQHYPNFDMRMK